VSVVQPFSQVNVGEKLEGMLRRTFLSGLGASLAPAFASHGVRLGIDAYSLRSWGWNATKLLDYTIARKLDAIQFSTLDQFEGFDPAYLNGLRERAAQSGVLLEVGISSICHLSAGWNGKWGTPAEYLTKAIHTAHGMGARTIKAYVGNSADRAGSVPIERKIEETLKVLRSVRSVAVDKQVKIAMENHSGDLQARELKDLIEAAGKDWVGCNFDSGNPVMTLEDPMLSLEILGPYVLTTHLRDVIVFEHERGAAWQWVAIGDGLIDWARFTTRFRQLCPNAAMLLENITGRPPRVVPYYEKDFWKAFPKVSSSDFSSFVALAHRGRPFFGSMIIADVPGNHPPEYVTALRQQQQVDLERGLVAARKAGAGLNA
jgi:sugar phosphate isomerase/epimerase